MLSLLKKKARREPNLLAVTYVSMCKVLEGYIPIGEFLDMDVTSVGEILDAVIYLNKESEKVNRGHGMPNNFKKPRRGRR